MSSKGHYCIRILKKPTSYLSQDKRRGLILFSQFIQHTLEFFRKV